jgi:acetyl esterase/lipase
MEKQQKILIGAGALILTLTGAGIYLATNNSNTNQSQSNTANTPTPVDTPKSEVTTKATEEKDVVYATKSSSQKLDIYVPDAKTQNGVPIIVNIHGGAFKSGDKSGSATGSGFSGGSQTDTFKEEAMKRGYAYASVNYRLSGEAVFPAAINDVKASIRYIKANAAKYGINKNMVFTIGGSAGGNLAALAATSGDLNYIGESENLGNETENSVLAGAVDMFGPINFLTMDSDFAELGVSNAPVTDSETSPESQYIGAKISTQPDKVKQADPTTYIDEKDPKIYISAGDQDRNIPYIQGEKLAKAINQKKSGNATWKLLAGEGHGTTGFSTSENIKEMLDFIDAIAKQS